MEVTLRKHKKQTENLSLADPMKLDAITLEFARQVIEEETGTPFDFKSSVPPAATEATLVARDDKKNPLISRGVTSTR